MLVYLVRKSEKERGPAVQLGLGPNSTAMALDDPLHDGESDAGSLILFGRMQSLKHAKQFVGIPHVKADTVVFHEIG